MLCTSDIGFGVRIRVYHNPSGLAGLGAWQVRQREGGHGAGSVSALRPLRAAILELLQLRRRAGLNALSQVLRCHMHGKLTRFHCAVCAAPLACKYAACRVYMLCATRPRRVLE